MAQTGTIYGYHDGNTYSLANVYDEQLTSVKDNYTKVMLRFYTDTGIVDECGNEWVYCNSSGVETDIAVTAIGNKYANNRGCVGLNGGYLTLEKEFTFGDKPLFITIAANCYNTSKTFGNTYNSTNYTSVSFPIFVIPDKDDPSVALFGLWAGASRPGITQTQKWTTYARTCMFDSLKNINISNGVYLHESSYYGNWLYPRIYRFVYVPDNIIYSNAESFWHSEVYTGNARLGLHYPVGTSNEWLGKKFNRIYIGKDVTNTMTTSEASCFESTSSMRIWDFTIVEGRYPKGFTTKLRLDTSTVTTLTESFYSEIQPDVDVSSNMLIRHNDANHYIPLTTSTANTSAPYIAVRHGNTNFYTLK